MDAQQARICTVCGGKDHYPAESPMRQACTTCEKRTVHAVVPVVYVLIGADAYEGETAYGAYASREVARAALEVVGLYKHDDWFIYEVEINSPPEPLYLLPVACEA